MTNNKQKRIEEMIEEKQIRLDKILFEAKQLEEEISELKRKRQERERKRIKNQECKCGHKRKRHGKAISINYTDGKCQDCECSHFLIKS